MNVLESQFFQSLQRRVLNLKIIILNHSLQMLLNSLPNSLIIRLHRNIPLRLNTNLPNIRNLLPRSINNDRNDFLNNLITMSTKDQFSQ